MLYGIFQGIDYFLEIIRYTMLAYCVLGWLLPPYHAVMRFLGRLIDPVLRPIRNILFRHFPRMMIDISPIIVFFILDGVRWLLWRLFSAL